MDKSRIDFFSKLAELEKVHNDYEETFKKIGLNVEGKDTLEILTYIAKQLLDIQLKLYDIERRIL